jgi:RES domain-containing protein
MGTPSLVTHTGKSTVRNNVPKVTATKLPGNWSQYPAPREIAELGDEWLKTKRTLLLKVPSAIELHEKNILLNPVHTEIKRVTVTNVEDFKFDRRLMK